MRTSFQKIVFALLFTSSAYSMGPKKPGGSNPSPSPNPPPASKWAHLDPKKYIPRHALEKAIEYFEANQSRISNKRYMSVIDFGRHSGQRRFFVVNMESGEVEPLHTAHGAGSDPDHNGYADEFSNKAESKMTSLGFYLTGSTYEGKHGYSLYLDGLSSTNSKARSRAIVIHGANYVKPSLSKMGRSWGCPALDRAVTNRVINQLKGKSLIYAYSDE